ncbi:MAG: hypothetical protein KIH08_12740 [Candidatus Freyarchaeota archaeon]|nr:hypothetical protein [Candidatus Jordarchaeia archaeon]MBS7270301.1 hypothetical protein [Candidatus Jordarchaeia archaeon]MBS7280999.1 hypothetical protein [Candidatus Jordarchaeia archaeon]
MVAIEITKQLKEELLTLNKEITNILDLKEVSSEQIRGLIADIDRCYILLDKFEETCKDFSYYFTLRKGLCSSLTQLTIALEAFEAGAVDLSSLKLAARNSNVKKQIETAIEKLEGRQIEA